VVETMMTNLRSLHAWAIQFP